MPQSRHTASACRSGWAFAQARPQSTDSQQCVTDHRPCRHRQAKNHPTDFGAIGQTSKRHSQCFADRKICNHVIPAWRTTRERVGRLMLQPQVTRGDANANTCHQHQQNRVCTTPSGLWTLDRATKKYQTHHDEYDALENTHRARFYVQCELHIVSICKHRCANRKTGDELLTKRPAQWIHNVTPQFVLGTLNRQRLVRCVPSSVAVSGKANRFIIAGDPRRDSLAPLK